VTVCLLMADDDPRPPRSIRSVATPYPNLARGLLRGVAPDAEVIAVNGSTEALVPDIADASLDLVETGTSAALNSLVVRRSFNYVTTHLARSGLCNPAPVAPVVRLLADAREAVR
jgi:ATP phosphoribosyltransferase